VGGEGGTGLGSTGREGADGVNLFPRLSFLVGFPSVAIEGSSGAERGDRWYGSGRKTQTAGSDRHGFSAHRLAVWHVSAVYLTGCTIKCRARRQQR
jgi:hypothetical protein